jgi:hypothetical protein
LRDPTPCSGQPRNGSVIPLSTPSSPTFPKFAPGLTNFPQFQHFHRVPQCH